MPAETMPPLTPASAQSAPWDNDDVPIVDDSESFSDIVSKLSTYIVKTIDAAYTYEQMRTSVAGQSLRPLIVSLSQDCHHPAIVAALMAARYLFDSKDSEDSGLSESRALACELVAWQFLTFLSEKELIDNLLYELPGVKEDKSAQRRQGNGNGHGFGQRTGNLTSDESSPLLESHHSENDGLGPPGRASIGTVDEDTGDLRELSSRRQDDLADSLAGMNALEIAAIADAKKFVSQKPVQKIVEDIWNGDVIFWENLGVHAVKKARTYNKRVADPFTRLRVPKYQKAFQVAFFVTFLILYYAVLVERNPQHIDFLEVLLYIWIIAFGYDEFGEIQDAGLMFYQTDFWSLWDLAIILVGAAFFLTRKCLCLPRGHQPRQ
jgi:hypothetical protein